MSTGWGTLLPTRSTAFSSLSMNEGLPGLAAEFAAMNASKYSLKNLVIDD